MLHELWAEAGRVRTVRFMFAEENRGKEIKERIQKDLKQYKKAVILTGMILGTMQILFRQNDTRIGIGRSYGFSVWEAGVSFAM